VLEEILHVRSCKGQSIADFIQQNINEVVQLTCLACEQDEALIKNQAQMLFKLLMNEILTNKLPLREQFEILYVKCVLKPVIGRIAELNKPPVTEGSADGQKEQQPPGQSLSDNEEEPTALNSSDEPQHSSELADHRFSTHLTFLLEVILSISPEDLGLLFLMYDCQHFSENIVTKSLNLLIRYAKHDDHKMTHLYQMLSKQLSTLSPNKDLDPQIVHVTHQRIKYMLDQKSEKKTLARQCNIKPKLFLNKCKEQYGFIDEDAPWEVASKILLYSREVVVEHVTEIVGGKEDRNKLIYSAFLDK
jgi:hypothetical protein